MKQEELVSPKLAGYMRFFQVLEQLEADKSIISQEKKLLKQKITLKDIDLTHIVSTAPDEASLKDQVLSFLRQLSPMQGKYIRSKSSAQDLSPGKRGDSLVGQACKSMEKLCKQLVCLRQSQELGQFESNSSFYRQLQEVVKLAQEVGSQRGSLFDIVNEQPKVDLIEELEMEYRKFKVCVCTMKQRYSGYMNSLLVLMDEKVAPEHIYSFLETLMSSLIGCRSYAFVIVKNMQIQLISSKDQNSKFVAFSIDQLDELVRIQFFAALKSMPLLRHQVAFGDQSFVVKLSEVEYFIIDHSDPDLSEFVPLSLQYGYFEQIESFCKFVMHTHQMAKVQYFSALQIGDAVLEAGLDLARCSKYLLIEKLLKLLQIEYQIEKFEGLTPTSQTDEIILRFKDTPKNWEYSVKHMNLTNSMDLRIYDTSQYLFQRYSQFLKQCYERISIYKFFIRSKNLVMVDFEKSGKLQFLSKAISGRLKTKYSIEDCKLGQTNYKELFKNNENLLKHIENYISEYKKWRMLEENSNEYELFVKREENQFKGFTLILSDNEWTRKKTQPPNQGPEMRKTLLKQKLQNDTLDYIQKLEEFNPEIRNSVVSMFMPQKDADSISVISQKTPTLIFRKLDKEQIVGKNSFFFKHREEEKKNIVQKLNPNRFSESSLVVKDSDNIVDSFSFNVLEVNNKIEKFRLAWTILDRNSFIQTFAIPLDKLVNFLNELEQQYNQYNNPFHNFDHGIAVMQSSHFIIRKLNMPVLNNQIRFCLILSALCHDVAHTGKTNIYEANSLSQLAIRYHDKVILEQHHAAMTVKILRENSTNILCNFSDADFKAFRKQLIHNILSTDMQEHFKMLKEFESRMETFGNEPDDVQLLRGMITHTADFNGPARKWSQSKIWSEKINQEYRAQYEEEGRRGYQQQPFMKDLDKLHVMAKNEIGFFKVIVRPLYFVMNKFSKGMLQECLENLDETILEWDKIQQEEEKKTQK